MSELDDLEAALRASWDRDHLAVYADHLQAHGDPRGELIAIDLAGAPPELESRRIQLVMAWLGATPTVSHFKTKFGFVETIAVTAADTLDNVTTPYVRSLHVDGTADKIAAAIAAIARRPWPWLDELVIAHDGDIPSSPIVTRKLATALIAATPQLRRLEISGRRVFGATFDHPSVRHLVISGYDAIKSLSGDGPPLANVVELDFAFHRDALLDHLPSPPPELVRAVLPAARLPALRTLDLSRNEPGSRGMNHLGGEVDVFGWLRASDLTGLAQLRLPSLRHERQLADLAAVVARMPGTSIVLARTYSTSPAPPAGVTAPPPRPWPSRDQVHGRDALTVTMIGEPYSEDLDLSGAVELMERGFDTWSPECRAAWTEFWEFLDDLGWDDADGNAIEMQLPAIILTRALEPLDLNDARRWSELRDVLRRRAATLPDTVSIRRYWGW